MKQQYFQISGSRYFKMKADCPSRKLENISLVKNNCKYTAVVTS